MLFWSFSWSHKTLCSASEAIKLVPAWTLCPNRSSRSDWADCQRVSFQLRQSPSFFFFSVNHQKDRTEALYPGRSDTPMLNRQTHAACLQVFSTNLHDWLTASQGTALTSTILMIQQHKAVAQNIDGSLVEWLSWQLVFLAASLRTQAALVLKGTSCVGLHCKKTPTTRTQNVPLLFSDYVNLGNSSCFLVPQKKKIPKIRLLAISTLSINYVNYGHA